MKKIIVSAAFFAMSLATTKANTINSDSGKGNSVHNILSTQLPSALLKNIKKEYSTYWITELVEKDNNKKPAYFITLENADQVVKLSCDNTKKLERDKCFTESPVRIELPLNMLCK